jgi:hypothetical protein
LAVSILWETVLSPAKKAFPNGIDHLKALSPIARRMDPLPRKMENSLILTMSPPRETVPEMADSVVSI